MQHKTEQAFRKPGQTRAPSAGQHLIEKVAPRLFDNKSPKINKPKREQSNKREADFHHTQPTNYVAQKQYHKRLSFSLAVIQEEPTPESENQEFMETNNGIKIG